MDVESWGVAVERRQAERARRVLAGRGLLAPRLRPARMDDRIVFPVTSPGPAIEALEAEGVRAEPVRARFEASPPRPGPLEGPVRGYAVIGDIALFSQARGVPLEEYRRLGRRLLETHPRVRSVWLKTRTTGDHRVPSLVHLAGEERTETVAVEYGIRLRVDIARAYYNPRLSYEHRRVALEARPGERILDMFAGIGAFPIHAATLHPVQAVAADINPHAARLAAENARLNMRRLQGTVHVLHADARLLPETLRPVFDRIIMNLPGNALDYAPVACRLAAPQAAIHVYVRTAGQDQAVRAALDAFARSGCRARLAGARRVLDYSPQEAVYAVDLEVERTG